MVSCFGPRQLGVGQLEDLLERIGLDDRSFESFDF